MDARFRFLAFDMRERSLEGEPLEELPIELHIQSSDGDFIAAVWCQMLKPDYPLDPSLAQLEKRYGVQEWHGCYVPVYNGPVANLPIRLPNEYNPDIHELYEPEE